jgi:hypothetical protein
MRIEIPAHLSQGGSAIGETSILFALFQSNGWLPWGSMPEQHAAIARFKRDQRGWRGDFTNDPAQMTAWVHEEPMPTTSLAAFCASCRCGALFHTAWAKLLP